LNAPRRFLSDKYWNEPVKWNRDALTKGTRARVFCASMCDVFEDRPDLLAPRSRLFQLIEATPALDWQLLTKRPENIMKLMSATYSNVWLGVSAEDQKHWDSRISVLLGIAATVHFVSAEPLLGSIRLNGLYPDWVIVGGESGPRCRPFDVQWARLIRDQCKEVGVAYFLKQLGGYPNKRHALSDFPKDLQIREMPVGSKPGMQLPQEQPRRR
jgi:protein gp37